MDPSLLKKKIREERIRLLDLQEEVEDFKGRLCEMRDRTVQSIERQSSHCESRCTQVWEDFDAFMEAARLKAEELCGQMRRETDERTSEWRLSLQKQESLLEEAERWLGHFRHFLTPEVIKDVGEVRWIGSLGEKLSSRLPKSFAAPVEECHFELTFPECCRRMLSELQKEMVRTWTPRDFEPQHECRLQVSNPVFNSFAVSDEDDHVFVVDICRCSVLEFNLSGEVVGRCHLEEGGEEFLPLDICRLSGDTFVVCGSHRSGWRSGWRGRLLFLSRQKSRPFLKIEKRIDGEGKEFSLCQMDGKIFVSDLDFKRIFSFSKEGKEMKTIEIGASPLSRLSSYPVLRADPTTGNLWATKIGMSEICVFHQNGELLRSVKTEEGIRHFCGDGFGRFYFCTEEGIFSISPKKLQFKFPKRSENNPMIFASPPKLFLYFENYGKNLMKIFKIN